MKWSQSEALRGMIGMSFGFGLINLLTGKYIEAFDFMWLLIWCIIWGYLFK